jgi:hypothetical protein
MGSCAFVLLDRLWKIWLTTAKLSCNLGINRREFQAQKSCRIYSLYFQQQQGTQQIETALALSNAVSIWKRCQQNQVKGVQVINEKPIHYPSGKNDWKHVLLLGWQHGAAVTAWSFSYTEKRKTNWNRQRLFCTLVLPLRSKRIVPSVFSSWAARLHGNKGCVGPIGQM